MKQVETVSKTSKLSKIIKYGVLIIIFCIALFSRFYHADLRYSFDEDSTRDALVAIEGAKTLQLPLTGPFSSIGAFTFGPWHYYQLILFTLILQTAYAPWIYMGILSILFITILYFIGTLIENRTFGIILALLAVLSPPQITSGMSVSNPNMIPFYSGLSILIFLWISKKNTSNLWGLLLGLTLGIGMNIHYQMMGILILPLLLLLTKRWKHALLTGVGIAITFIPLLIFDLNNHWYTLRGMYVYYRFGKDMIYVPNRWLFYLRDFWPLLWSNTLGIQPLLGLIIMIITPIAILWRYFQKKFTSLHILLAIAFLFNIILLRFYWGVRSFAYCQYLQPFIFFFSGYLIYAISKIKYMKIPVYLGLAAFIGFLAYSNLPLFEDHQNNKEMRREAEVIKQNFPNEKVTIYNCGLHYRIRAQAVSVLLYNDKIHDPSGRKIAFASVYCAYPKTNEIGVASYIDIEGRETIYPQLTNIDMFDFSIASEAAIRAEGWVPTTGTTLYNDVLRWWFNEQP